MNVENCIEAQYRELMECSEPNAEYADLYKAFTHPHLLRIRIFEKSLQLCIMI